MIEDDWERKRRERAEEEEEENEKLEFDKFRDEKLKGVQVNLELSSQEEKYHPNDEVTLLNENPEIFRKAPPIRPRGMNMKRLKREKERGRELLPTGWEIRRKMKTRIFLKSGQQLTPG